MLITPQYKLICNLRCALRDADKNSTSPTCLGCGHDKDMTIDQHKIDCLIYKPDGTPKKGNDQ